MRNVKLDLDFTLINCITCLLISCLLIQCSDIINVDVYHKKKKSNSNLHHFGVSCFLYNINDFIFHVF